VTVAESLRGWFAARLDDPSAAVLDLTRHSEGFSWETYTLDVVAGGERRGYAVRVEPQDGLLAPYDIEQQYELHRAVLERSDVPMAELHWLELDPSVVGGRFYVMERLRGRVPVQWAGDDPDIFPTAAARQALGNEFVDIQARIHAVDWRGALDGPEATVDRWAEAYERAVRLEVPMLRYAIGWLRANEASSGRVVLCHGDYRIGNFMVAAGRIVGVFDWELAHAGDPVEDIAYSGLPLWRGRAQLLSQLLPAGEYFARYEERTGLRVEPEAFRYWTVLGLVKAASAFLQAARAFEEGRTGDLRLAALGHQLHHVLRLLARELGL
jgi:aminoglycoside phosphotransferase (APT) family kinase protein